MPLQDWSDARAELTTLLELLLAEEGENEDREPKEVNGKKEPVKVRGSLVGLVERLDEEVRLPSLFVCSSGEARVYAYVFSIGRFSSCQFTKSLQHIDAHGMEYVERLKDESVLYTVLCQTQQWFEASSAPQNIARVILRRLEHVYAKVR
jgi:hypothetical protein